MCPNSRWLLYDTITESYVQGVRQLQKGEKREKREKREKSKCEIGAVLQSAIRRSPRLAVSVLSTRVRVAVLQDK